MVLSSFSDDLLQLNDLLLKVGILLDEPSDVHGNILGGCTLVIALVIGLLVGLVVALLATLLVRLLVHLLVGLLAGLLV